MEETKGTQKLSYEELENVAVQFQHRAMALENQLRSINTVTFRLNYLFKVLENKSVFPEDFIQKCATEVVETLTIEDTPVETPDAEAPKE